jgi:hypothetical protein
MKVIPPILQRIGGITFIGCTQRIGGITLMGCTQMIGGITFIGCTQRIFYKLSTCVHLSIYVPFLTIII